MFPIRLRVKPKPHSGQLAFLSSGARFRIVACGRRFGKTTGAIMDMLKHLEKGITRFWWIAPTYQQAKIAFRVLVAALPNSVVNINRSELRIQFLDIAEFEFKTAERPDNLRGFGLDYVVIDEAGYIADDVWEAVIRPALADRQGKLLAIGTPRGKNWFYRLWLKGQERNQTECQSWQMPSWGNPFLPKAEIEMLKATLPERIWKQEIEAVFLDNAGGVFRNVEAVVQSYALPAQPQGRVIVGVDLAKYEDFTVLVAMDERGRVIDFDRFNQLDWEIQKARIKNMARKYNATLVLDSTGVGDPIYEDLRMMGLSVEGYKFTNESKERLINNLAIQIENRKILLPNIPELISELQAFEYEILPSGMVRFGAPTGYHDDCVIALALATWGTRTQQDAMILDKSDWGVW